MPLRETIDMGPENIREGIGAIAIETPTEEQFLRVAERQRRELGSSYDQAFHPQNLGEAVRRFQTKYMEEVSRLKLMSWGPASVINLMPYPLNINGVLHGRLMGGDGNQVPACPPGTAWIQRVIREPGWSVRDEGAGMDNIDNYTPIPWIPVVLAKEYETEFRDLGGVFVYEGDQSPLPQFAQRMEQAQIGRNRYLQRRIMEAESDWADPSRRKHVTDIHRKAAEVLVGLKILRKPPDWLIVNSNVGKSPDACPVCGHVSETRAIACTACNYVYNPLAAYKAAIIEFGHVAMDRMNAEEWREAGEIKARREEARAAGAGPHNGKSKTTKQAKEAE